jgi:hypothetical protein
MIHPAVGSVLPAFLFLQAPGTPASAILGTWRGTSICVDRATDRSCRDETVVYEVDSAAGPRGPVRMRADKIVGGVREPMGVLRLQYDSTTRRWSMEFEARFHARWSFEPAGDSMLGALRELPSLRLVRRVAVRREPGSPPLALSHAWIVVTPGAPERRALEQAGFRIAATVNRHDGQGTASVTVEFLNGFLELIYPDSTVPVSPALQAGAEKFRLKSAWRETGYSPIGVVFDRTPATPDTFPFATWKVTAAWMEKTTYIEMLTPREMPRAVSLSISSHPAGTREHEAPAPDSPAAAIYLHPNGARRLTGLRVVAPDADRLPPAAAYLAGFGLVTFDTGGAWLLEVTLDGGKQRVTRDFRPELPMVVHF